jgi:hypothetical protein
VAHFRLAVSYNAFQGHLGQSGGRYDVRLFRNKFPPVALAILPLF